jgi:3-hydroxyacyl-CoA dehydrogenase
MQTVTIIGANGTMGSSCAGIVAGFGAAKVYMLARGLDKACLGVERAVSTVRSDAIRPRLVPRDMADIEECVRESDWIIEAVAENVEAKLEVNARIAPFARKGAIVSSVTSGLSIDEIGAVFAADDKPDYFGTHFYNPPHLMPLCELIPSSGVPESVSADLAAHLRAVLRREVVFTANTPGFLGNRIGFQLLNEAAQYAERHAAQGGVSYIDSVLGVFTGRAMPPLATSDFVGLDVHKAIVENISARADDSLRATFELSPFVEMLIDKGHVGKKGGSGFYGKVSLPDGREERTVYSITDEDYRPVVRDRPEFSRRMSALIGQGRYKCAVRELVSSESDEAEICRHFVARYVSYAPSLVGTVCDSLASIDRVMAYGFHWASPASWINFLGGSRNAADLVERMGLEIPPALISLGKEYGNSQIPEVVDGRRFFRASG